MNMTSWSKWRCVRPNFFFFNNWIFLLEFLPWEIRVAFPGESQLRQSRATQSVVHAGCFSVSVIHRPLTWTTGSLTCTQMLKNANAHGRVRTPWKSLHWKLTLGEKSLAAPENRTCLSGVPVRRSTNWATSPPQICFHLRLLNINALMFNKDGDMVHAATEREVGCWQICFCHIEVRSRVFSKHFFTRI